MAVKPNNTVLLLLVMLKNQAYMAKKMTRIKYMGSMFIWIMTRMKIELPEK